MEPFRAHTGTIAVLPGDHVDTDRIIPARYLSRIERAGYGELAFADLRGPDFVLDTPASQGASILVVGTNFGCGSSREHAVWAIQQAGFRAVIARRDADSPGYSDIFRSNAANNGLLLIELDAGPHAEAVALGTGATLTVNLEDQVVRGLPSGDARFEIAPMTRAAILAGLDLIGTTLSFGDQITAFEATMPTFVPSKGA
ncbi:MAG: 3-isopropylmalate dehydratase small subunit [Fimbriimonadaceae bacterium]|nr:3-isopropylmalate dehydratase small subunit [Fimbriimonadaceae bacterium]